MFRHEALHYSMTLSKHNKYIRILLSATLIILCLLMLAGCGSKKNKIEIHSSSSDAVAVTVDEGRI